MFLHGPRLHEGHFAVRFGDAVMQDERGNPAEVQIFKDGERIYDCIEVDAPTRAWRWLGGYPCPCGSGDIEYVLDESGAFSVRIDRGQSA